MHKKLSITMVLTIFCLAFLCGCQLFCNHSWSEATCLVPKTCSLCNKSEGELAAHVWVDADCINPKTCTVCSETEGDVTDHSWVEADCTAPKTCSVCDTTEGTPLGHLWTDATCLTAKTCSTCSATDGDPLGHALGEPVLTVDYVEATETSTTSCTVCNDICDTKISNLERLHNGDIFLLNPYEFESRFNSIIETISPDCPYKVDYKLQLGIDDRGTLFSFDQYLQVNNGTIVQRDDAVSYYDDHAYRQMYFIECRCINLHTLYDSQYDRYLFSYGWSWSDPVGIIAGMEIHLKNNPYAKDLMTALLMTFLPDLTPESAWGICTNENAHNWCIPLFVHNGVFIQISHADATGYSGDWEDSVTFSVSLYPLPDDSPHNIDHTIAFS